MELDEQQKQNRKGIVLAVCITCAVICVIVLAAFTTLTVLLLNRQEKPTPTQEDLRIAVATKFERNMVEINTGDEIGSGVIVEIKEGKVLVVTNHHVIKNFNTSPINLKFYNYSQAIEGVAILGYNDLYDIAVLELEHKLPFVVEDIFGTMQVDFEPSMGEGVLGLGNALGSGIAAIDGIVSKVNQVIKPINVAFHVPLIKTTAPINEGNSGGGLFNLDGKLIGINGYRVGIFNEKPVDGISYAIPINIVYSLYRSALNQRSSEVLNVPDARLSIGDTAYYIQSGMGFSLKYSDDKLLVHNFSAAVSEFMVGDEIISIGDIDVKPYDYSSVIAEFLSYRTDNTGEQLTIKYLRNGDQRVAKFNKYKYN